jgi:uncharacterized protein (DUF2336 family)
VRAQERYSKLLQIANDRSHEKRRSLLVEVTDMFFGSLGEQSPKEAKLFGDVITKVAYELDVEERRYLSRRFSRGHAPRRLAIALANDEIGIAEPILQRSLSLTQRDLIKVVEMRGHAHQMVVTLRSDIGETLSETLVTNGNDRVVASLVLNQSSQISYNTFDKIVERAANNNKLHGPIVKRKVVPAEHLKWMFLIVEGPLRREILTRNPEVKEEEIGPETRPAQTRLAFVIGSIPADYETAKRHFSREKANKLIDQSDLPSMWRNGEITKFMIAFSDFTGIDFTQTLMVFEKKDVEMLAMLCRSANFERSLFVTIAVLMLETNGMAQTKKLGDVYNEVSREVARRAVQFLKQRPI